MYNTLGFLINFFFLRRLIMALFFPGAYASYNNSTASTTISSGFSSAGLAGNTSLNPFFAMGCSYTAGAIQGAETYEITFERLHASTNHFAMWQLACDRTAYDQGAGNFGDVNGSKVHTGYFARRSDGSGVSITGFISGAGASVQADGAVLETLSIIGTGISIVTGGSQVANHCANTYTAKTACDESTDGTTRKSLSLNIPYQSIRTMGCLDTLEPQYPAELSGETEFLANVPSVSVGSNLLIRVGNYGATGTVTSSTSSGGGGDGGPLTVVTSITAFNTLTFQQTWS